MFEYCSFAPYINEIIDCRIVEMSFDFFNAQSSQINFLAEYYVSEMRRLLGDTFYLNWRYSGKNTKETSLLKKPHKKDKGYRISFEGDAFSEIVFDHRSFQQYEKYLLNPFRQIPADPFGSIDYLDIFNALFKEANSLDQIKTALLELFEIEGRIKKTAWCAHDAMSYLSVRKEFEDFFCGKGYFRIGLFCLGKHADAFANALSRFLKSLAGFLPNLSGYIALTPITASCMSNHMLYFGGEIANNLPNSNDINAQDFPEFSYLSAAEWYNVLSAPQVALLSGREYPHGVEIESLEHGGMVVKAASQCTQTQIKDLRLIKQFLYPALFPGSRKVNLSQLLDPACMASLYKPRYGWEQIPIFEDEISVFEDSVLFQHRA